MSIAACQRSLVHFFDHSKYDVENGLVGNSVEGQAGVQMKILFIPENVSLTIPLRNTRWLYW